jgi:hypothetical protein
MSMDDFRRALDAIAPTTRTGTGRNDTSDKDTD